MIQKIPVAILAATGSVGQRFVQLLDGHPWFEVIALSGSDRSVGQPYQQACHWLLSESMPEWAKEMPVLPTDPAFITAPIIFSALPADAASIIEPAFAQNGQWICSNASAFRREEDVPLLLPEVNPDHISLLEIQQKKRGWSGGIITNPNCASTGITVALKSLQDSFGLKKVLIVTLQAISGAGYPGVASMDIMDNVIPFINGEEEKLEWEPRKILGKLQNEKLNLADFKLSSQVNRVPVIDGHMANIFVELENPANIEAAEASLQNFKIPEISSKLPSASAPAILVRQEDNRPQPRLDRNTGNGMTTVVGRLRKDNLFDLKMVVLSHNTIRGAAGGSIYNAELLVRSGYFPSAVPWASFNQVKTLLAAQIL